ncbi:MAG: SDR family oxidoreductase [Gemmatimonadetes bacterium]|nr:SDR family oxidoreductase [Gemmatimonadota bacterium]
MPEARTIVLTGVGRPGQVGEAVAAAFATPGAVLHLIDRDASVADRARDLGGSGATVHAHVADLTDGDAVKAVAAKVGPSLDALVHMAGGFAMSGPVAEADVAVMRRQLAISLETAFFATQAFLPALRAAKGAIVYFGAAAVLEGGTTRGMSGYAASKAALLAFMRAVAQEERATGVRANAIAPTAIRTAMNESSMGSAFDYVEREEVARTVAWLASSASSAVTGQVVRLG